MSKRKIIDYFSKNTNQDDCEPTSSKNSTKTPSTLNKTESMHANENDISLFVNRRLSDADKFTALKNVWLPLTTFEFPLNQKNKKRGLKFQYKWLLQFNWLVYSKIKNGAYCKFCVVFAKCGGIRNQPLNKLVLEAFDAWKKALECDFEPKIRTLKRLCATRWVQRYDAVNDFVELFPCVVAALEIITEWNDSSATDAAILLKAIDSEFLISLQITKFLFSYGLPLCKQLQSKKIDLVEAVCLAEDIISALQNIRINIEQEFNNIFLMAKEMAKVISLNLSVKRITKRQTNRANFFTDSDNNKISDINVEHYYRTTIFIPYLDFFIAQLEERFTAHKTIFKGFETIFSKNQFLNASEIESFKNLAEFYSPHVNKDNSLAELKIWRTKILDNSEVIKTGLDALQLCSSSIYTNLNKLLKILCVLPVLTSTPERTFSTLKRVKTFTRNSMLEDRLNGLTLLAVHKDISITPDEVLDEMSMKPRKLELIL
ncbi:52 kDa repressor of the inhibitor of the protein kinase-like [Metopolophium dirhodum]|uniref:52 kDa repressor of the inhibitor of the protein kinase-like n=1 Tax=Metopolophium dirhodum TaxID=44670 RepID=UPI0029901523|nr:52 kDa repressor of the inhibitor of the protein kinase-like [Metopolophium dirhodum]